jgi:hypothetical protein
MILRAGFFAFASIAVLMAADYKDVNRTVSLTPSGSVTIETHKGSIRVTTWDRAAVEIKARIEAEPGTTMDQRRFEGTDVRIVSSPEAVEIRTEYPEFGWCCNDDEGNNPEVRYTIQMPRTGKLTIRDHRSETEIADLEGALDIDTHRGTVRVHRLAGSLQLTTHRGDVQVEFAKLTGNVSIDTHRGTIELAMPRNSRFDVRTDLGKHASLDTDFPQTSGGGPIVDLKTYRGSIRLRAL